MILFLACNQYFEPLQKSQICLGYKSKYNACRGDSGGPFLQSIVSCIFYLLTTFILL